MRGEPLQAETLFEELTFFKNFCNELKDENMRLRTSIIKYEVMTFIYFKLKILKQEIKNYEKVVADLNGMENNNAQILRGPLDVICFLNFFIKKLFLCLHFLITLFFFIMHFMILFLSIEK